LGYVAELAALAGYPRALHRFRFKMETEALEPWLMEAY